MKSCVLIIVSVLLVHGSVHSETDPVCPPGYLMDFVRGTCWRNIIACKATPQRPLLDLGVQNSLDEALNEGQQLEEEQTTQFSEFSEQPEPNDRSSDFNNDLYRSETPGLTVITQDTEQSSQLFEFPEGYGDQEEQVTTESTNGENDENKSGEGQSREDQETDRPGGLTLLGSEQTKRHLAECTAEVESLQKNIVSLRSLAKERDEFTAAAMNRITLLENEQQHQITMLLEQNQLLEAQIEEVGIERYNRGLCEEARDEATSRISEMQVELDRKNQNIEDLNYTVQSQKFLMIKKDKHIARLKSIILQLQAQFSSIMYGGSIQSTQSSMETGVDEDVSYPQY